MDQRFGAVDEYFRARDAEHAVPLTEEMMVIDPPFTFNKGSETRRPLIVSVPVR